MTAAFRTSTPRPQAVQEASEADSPKLGDTEDPEDPDSKD